MRMILSVLTSGSRRTTLRVAAYPPNIRLLEMSYLEHFPPPYFDFFVLWEIGDRLRIEGIRTT